MVLNKNLQVTLPKPEKHVKEAANAGTGRLGNQYPEHECGACRSNVQELSIECAIPLGR